jgi:YafQ family addiction module toxin component
MSYIIEVVPSCRRSIEKVCKKNAVLRKSVRGKMRQILSNPTHYKPLRHDLSGERRVHILKSFVLKFRIDETRKVVTFIAFDHHDEAYRR